MFLITDLQPLYYIYITEKFYYIRSCINSPDYYVDQHYIQESF